MKRKRTRERLEKFEALYLEYKNLLFYLAHEYLKDPMLAEDAVQEAFIRILQNMECIKDVDSPETRRYLITLIRWMSLNMLKQKRRRKEEFPEETFMWDEIAGEEDRLSIEEERMVIEAIKNLPELDRDIFLMKFSSGYSEKEIAKMLDMSYSSVRMRIVRARKKLQKELGEEMNEGQ